MEGLIYEIVHGSVCYGLNTSKSDLDIKGIFIPSIRNYFTLEKNKDVIERKFEGNDLVYFSLEKFFSLAAAANPNILEQIFVKEEFVRFSTSFSEMIRENRGMFLSRKVAKTFVGYAMSSLGKLKKENIENVTSTRRENIEKFGFCTKNAMHLLRLLRSGLELYETGVLNVFRETDQDFLLSVREGRVSLEEILSEKDKVLLRLEKIKEKNLSPLPEAPDYGRINDIMFELINRYFFKEKCI